MLHIDHDLHIYTYLSACCRDKERQQPGAIIALAERMGVRTLGFAGLIECNRRPRCRDRLPNDLLNWWEIEDSNLRPLACQAGKGVFLAMN
jgi:hypothetical protein